MFYGDLLEKRRTEAEKEQEKFVAQIIYIFISSPILLLSGFFRLLLNFFKISSKFMRFFLAYLANLSEEEYLQHYIISEMCLIPLCSVRISYNIIILQRNQRFQDKLYSENSTVIPRNSILIGI